MKENIIFYIIIIISYFLFALFRFIHSRRLQNGSPLSSLLRRSGNNSSSPCSWWWFCGCFCGSGRRRQRRPRRLQQERQLESELHYWYEERYNFDEVSLRTATTSSRARADGGYNEQRRNYILDRIIVQVSIVHCIIPFPYIQSSSYDYVMFDVLFQIFICLKYTSSIIICIILYSSIVVSFLLIYLYLFY